MLKIPQHPAQAIHTSRVERHISPYGDKKKMIDILLRRLVERTRHITQLTQKCFYFSIAKSEVDIVSNLVEVHNRSFQTGLVMDKKDLIRPYYCTYQGRSLEMCFNSPV